MDTALPFGLRSAPKIFNALGLVSPFKVRRAFKLPCKLSERPKIRIKIEKQLINANSPYRNYLKKFSEADLDEIAISHTKR